MAYVHPKTVAKVRPPKQAGKLGFKGKVRPNFGPPSRAGMGKLGFTGPTRPGFPTRRYSKAATAAAFKATTPEARAGLPAKRPVGGPATPATPASTTANPFLTPAQQAALNKYDTNYGLKIAAIERSLSDATFNTNQSLANNAQARISQSSDANQSMAARGLFQSSIRDGDLNDIDATMTMRNNLLNTNLNRLTIDLGARRSGLNTDLGITHNAYNQLAVQNAAALTPILPTAPVAPTSSTGGTAGAASTGGAPAPAPASAPAPAPLAAPTATTPLEQNTTGLVDPLAAPKLGPLGFTGPIRANFGPGTPK